MIFRTIATFTFVLFLFNSSAFAQAVSPGKNSRPQFDVSVTLEYLDSDELERTAASLNGRFPIAAVQDIAVFADAEAGIYEYGDESPLDTSVEKLELGVGINAYRLGHIVRVAVGSVSDEPFNSSDEIYFSILALFKVYEREEHSWHIGAIYNSTKDFPYPAVYYAYDTPDLYVQIGLPFNLEWQAAEKWSLSVNYRPVYEFDAEFLYHFNDAVSAGPRVEMTVDKVAIADRPDEDEYFFVRTGRAGLVLRYNSTKATFGLTFFAGVLFDGEYFAGEDSTDNDSATDINDGFVTMVSIWARF